jgi:hypothetical protein
MGTSCPTGAEMKVHELIEKLQKMDPQEEVWAHCAFKEKSPEFDIDFFQINHVADMGRVVLFED